jgi:hypothetical protein
LTWCFPSNNINTSKQLKPLTEPEETPIIAPEALLSLVKWIRRQKHEGTMSGVAGTQKEPSGTPQTPTSCAGGTDDLSVSHHTGEQRGDHDEDGT